MLVRTDPFQALDRLTQQFFGAATRSAAMPLDAYREGDRFVVHFDLPGVSPESIEVDVQNDVLTVKAERTAVTGDGVRTLISERPAGTFSRQLFLGDTLDTDHIEAGYDAGVLTLRIPVAEQAKPRKIAVTSGRVERKAINA
ncbi:Hsp20/alpha crystallin family protein [Amycolatopsis rifamycinica]|uniref:Heat-shock protein Hsp20 n=1 Tax=Amycolatopsis rifamycinica TaxID=287986 RepID=A0A066U363_9PSEU|nr:Hsp20/alpha crystallin family protein [Amycolatopsis rifamycinica]KDN21896.1 heat-shock protein Hsp20 [Amycolatopsis rifamycinica]